MVDELEDEAINFDGDNLEGFDVDAADGDMTRGDDFADLEEKDPLELGE